jgi:hypothetical protein
VQTALAGGADVHARTFADGFESLENRDGLSAVLLLCFLFRSSHERKGPYSLGWGWCSGGSGYRRQVMGSVYRQIATAPILRLRFYTPIRAAWGISRSEVREDT